MSIDSTLAPGHLSYGELRPAGRGPGARSSSRRHVCHPSLADDNLSSIAVATALARDLASRPHRYTYRFLFAPGTIGTIAWLARNREVVPRIRAGLTLTCLGDGSPFTYKRTIGGTAEIDRAAALVLRDAGADHGEIDFYPFGYDERQYNSPGFPAPVGSLMRGRHGRFPEYHTSADNLEFISAENLAESLATVEAIVDVLEGNRTYTNLAPDGEPQLGKRGLYGAIGGTDIPDLNLAMLWVLTLSDGEHDLISIADRSGDAVGRRSAARRTCCATAACSPTCEGPRPRRSACRSPRLVGPGGSQDGLGGVPLHDPESGGGVGQPAGSSSSQSTAASTWIWAVFRIGRPAYDGSVRVSASSVPPRIRPSIASRSRIPAAIATRRSRVSSRITPRTSSSR